MSTDAEVSTSICYLLFRFLKMETVVSFLKLFLVLCTELQLHFFLHFFVCRLRFLVSNDFNFERVLGFCSFLPYLCSPLHYSLLFSFLGKSTILQSCIEPPQIGKNMLTNSEMFAWLNSYALCMTDCIMLCVWVIVSCFVYEWLCHAWCMTGHSTDCTLRRNEVDYVQWWLNCVPSSFSSLLLLSDS